MKRSGSLVFIGAILSWAEIGECEAPTGGELQGHFRRIRTQAERASGLTGQLLAFARRQVLQPEEIDLNRSISGMVTFVQSGMGENIRFESLLDPNLRAIQADRSQVEQVIMNLCINAKNAMPSGGSAPLTGVSLANHAQFQFSSNVSWSLRETNA